MECERCHNDDWPKNAGLSSSTAITKGAFWCRACFTKAGGKWPEVLTIGHDIEARLSQLRAEKIAKLAESKARRERSEKAHQRKKLRKATKARKTAVLLITRALRT